MTALALAVRLIGGIQISLAALAQDPPPLAEVEIFCFTHPDTGAISVHAMPVRPGAYLPYYPTNEQQVDLLGGLA